MDGARRCSAQLFVLDRGQLPSPCGPPRHHRTQLEARDILVSGECPNPIQNQPTGCGSLQTAVRGSLNAFAVRGSEVKPAAVRGSPKPAVHREVKPATVHGSLTQNIFTKYLTQIRRPRESQAHRHPRL